MRVDDRRRQTYIRICLSSQSTPASSPATPASPPGQLPRHFTLPRLRPDGLPVRRATCSAFPRLSAPRARSPPISTGTAATSFSPATAPVADTPRLDASADVSNGFDDASWGSPRGAMRREISATSSPECYLIAARFISTYCLTFHTAADDYYYARRSGRAALTRRAAGREIRRRSRLARRHLAPYRHTGRRFTTGSRLPRHRGRFNKCA